MPTKKHISALVYMAITSIMLFGVEQLERSCSVQTEVGMQRTDMQSPSYDVRCSRALISIDFYN